MLVWVLFSGIEMMWENGRIVLVWGCFGGIAIIWWIVGLLICLVCCVCVCV